MLSCSYNRAMQDFFFSFIYTKSLGKEEKKNDRREDPQGSKDVHILDHGMLAGMCGQQIAQPPGFSLLSK